MGRLSGCSCIKIMAARLTYPTSRVVSVWSETRRWPFIPVRRTKVGFSTISSRFQACPDVLLLLLARKPTSIGKDPKEALVSYGLVVLVLVVAAVVYQFKSQSPGRSQPVRTCFHFDRTRGQVVSPPPLLLRIFDYRPCMWQLTGF